MDEEEGGPAATTGGGGVDCATGDDVLYCGVG